MTSTKFLSHILMQFNNNEEYFSKYFVYPIGIWVLVIIVIFFLIQVLKIFRSKKFDESEEKFRVLMTTTASAIFVLRNDKFLYINPSAEELTSYSNEEIHSKTFWEFIHPEDLDLVKKNYSIVMNPNEISKRFECRIVTKHDKLKWVDVTIAGIKYQGQSAIIVSVFDITEKKNVNEALVISEQRYRILSDIMSEYAYLDKFNQDGSLEIIWATDSFTKMTGYSFEDAKTPGFQLTLLHPEERERGMEHFGKLFNGEGVEDEGRIITKEGKVLWCYHHAIPICDEVTGRVTHIYGVVRDITDRKLNEIEIMRQKQQLQSLTSELIQTQTQERKRLATYLHDSIGQALSVARMKIDDITNTVSKKDLEDIKSGISQSGNKELIDELNDLSNIILSSIKETRAVTFELSPPILYDLGLVPALDWLVGEMERQYKLTATLSNRTGKFQIADQVRDLLFEGTREMLMNVIKHAQATHVNIYVETKNSSVCVSVKDNGIGFDKSSMEKQNVERKSFGLYNLKERVYNVGGNFEIESTPGLGTFAKLIAPLIDTSQKH